MCLKRASQNLVTTSIGIDADCVPRFGAKPRSFRSIVIFERCSSTARCNEMSTRARGSDRAHAIARSSFLVDRGDDANPYVGARRKKEETCWTIGGEVSISGKTSLVTRLFSEIGASITFTGERQRCVTELEAVEFAVPVDQCWSNWARTEWVQTRATGRVREIEVRVQWRWENPGLGGYSLSSTNCGVQEARGSADRISDIFIRYTQKRCPQVPIRPDDPDDERRSTKCCSPLPPCDELGPLQDSCCGCVG